MDAYPLFIYGQISEPGIDPAARIIVVNPVVLDVDCLVRVSAENAPGIVLPGVLQGPRSHLR